MFNFFKKSNEAPRLYNHEKFKMVQFENGEFGVKDKARGWYYDLSSWSFCKFKWPTGSEYHVDCLGSYKRAKKAYDLLCKRHMKEIV